VKYISCILFFFYFLLPHSYCGSVEASIESAETLTEIQLDSSSSDTIIIYLSLEEALKNSKNVYQLNLRRNKLTEFPMEILELTNLQELNLSRNKIYEIPREIESLTKLRVLNLSKNKLQTIPAEIGKLKHLTQLILFQNEIHSLPPEIGELENLQFLDMWGNEIIEFPRELSGLKSLKVLDVRVIEMNKNRQNAIKELLPHTKIYFSNSCNCGD